MIWANIETQSLTLVPSEVIYSGWKAVSKTSLALVPSEVIYGGWKAVSSMNIALGPYLLCSVDADCPEGYVCVGGICVKEKAPFPWAWLAIGGTAAVAAILIISAQQKQKKK